MVTDTILFVENIVTGVEKAESMSFDITLAVRRC